MHSLCAQQPVSFGDYLSFYFNFELEGSILYWRTCRDDRLYATENNTVVGTQLDYKVVKPEADWGWRVKGVYWPNEYFFIDVEYTQFIEKDQATTSSNAFDQTYFVNPVPYITARIKDDYQRARARGGYLLWDGYRGDVYAFGGVSWVHLQEKNRLDSPPVGGVPLFLSQKSSFRGTCLEAGFGGHFKLFNCLGILAEYNGISAIGKQNFDFFLSTDDVDVSPPVTKDYPSETICIPGLDIRLEANYSFPSLQGCTIAVGYEHHHFFDVLRLSSLYSQAGVGVPIFLSDVLDLGFAGLYATFRINF